MRLPVFGNQHLHHQKPDSSLSVSALHNDFFVLAKIEKEC